jgi:excisionase family DNA binding protein
MTDLVDLKIFLAGILRPIIYEIIDEKFSQLPVTSGNTTFPNDKKFTIDELEVYTGIKKNTLYGMVSRGEIPVSKPGRQLIFVKSKIDQWLEDNRKKTTAEIAAAADDFLVSKRKTR